MNHLINLARVSFQAAFLEIRHHRLRSLLSILGIALGIAAYIAMSLIGELNVQKIRKFMAEMGGANQIAISKINPRNPREDYFFGRSPDLRPSDGEALKQTFSSLKSASFLYPVYRQYFTYEKETYDCGLVGTNLDFYHNNHFLVLGRDITTQEFTQGKNVAVMTEMLYQKLIKKQGEGVRKIVGRTLFVSGKYPVTIVGVIGKRSYTPEWNQSLRNALLLPLHYSEKNLIGINPEAWPGINCTVSEDENVENLMARIVRRLRELHRGNRDFLIQRQDNAQAMADEVNKTRNTLRFITFLSLMIGLLNVMSALFASLSSRQREIGIRKALGASEADIFVQFICESLLLSFAGGILGVALATLAGSTDQFAQLTGAALTFQGFGLPQVALIVILVGFFSGLLPALRAAFSPPMESIRHE